MTFKDYYKLTRETTKSCMTICGLVFTSIYALFAVIKGYRTNSVLDSIEIFVLFFILGNGLALFIWFLAIASAHGEYKSILRFYNSIPNGIKERLVLIVKPQNHKYNYLQLEILDTNSKHPYFFSYDKKHVWIAIVNDLNTVENFQKRMAEIQKRYKNEHIVLTGLGLRKNIKWRDWKMITTEKVTEILEELRAISVNEGLKTIDRD